MGRRPGDDPNVVYATGPTGSSTPPPRVRKGLGIGAGIAAAVVLALVVAFNSFYTISEQENAVVITFGVPSTVTTSGLHFKVPFVQQVKKVDMTIHGFALGYDQNTGEFVSDESLMITSDYNFVNVDFFVEYRVTDPAAYLYNSRQPELILKTLAQSYIRDTIGLYPVDEIITTGKGQIQTEIKEKIMNRLTAEDVGLQLVNITIQDAEPPTAEVLAAFKEVETAKQGAETAVNTANKYRSEQIPAAKAQADQILQKAEAEKQSRINEAEGQVARFNSMYQEYARYPLITKQRMYYETMEQLLPNLKVIIVDDSGKTLNVLTPDLGGSKLAAAN
ncbi:MAG: FtsH protease activity modulator HflK [Faecalibacterium sp.]|nr:FtsH protease activity modulator HflK [Faecalibacterium sp.]